ncbi:hypothetical protein [Enterobacter ludwigii]
MFNAMSLFKKCCVIFYVATLIFSLSTQAETIMCNPSTATGGNNYDQWSEYHIPFEVSPANVRVTTGEGLSDWSVIYTISRVNIGVSSGGCSPQSEG